MARRNEHVQYPREQIFQEPGDLEQYCFSLYSEGKLYKPQLDYEKLPPTFRSTAIDSYTSWLSDLTEQDPEQRERGSYVLLRTHDSALLLPSNPAVGTTYSCKPIPPGDFTKHWPLATIHSHPTTQCFSPKDWKSKAYSTTAESIKTFSTIEAVGTPRVNYLLLNTHQTSYVGEESHIESIFKNIENVWVSTDKNMSNFYRMIAMEVTDDQKEIELLSSRAEYASLVAQNEEFGAGFLELSQSLWVTSYLSNLYKIGFYYSNRDGIYHKYTDSYKKDIDNRLMQKVLPRTLEILRQIL